MEFFGFFSPNIQILWLLISSHKCHHPLRSTSTAKKAETITNKYAHEETLVNTETVLTKEQYDNLAKKYEELEKKFLEEKKKNIPYLIHLLIKDKEILFEEESFIPNVITPDITTKLLKYNKQQSNTD